MKTGTCYGCGETVLLLNHVQDDRFMMVNLEPDPGGFIQVDEMTDKWVAYARTKNAPAPGDLRLPHAKTCTNIHRLVKSTQEMAEDHEAAIQAFTVPEPAVEPPPKKKTPLRPVQPALVSPATLVSRQNKLVQENMEHRAHIESIAAEKPENLAELTVAGAPPEAVPEPVGAEPERGGPVVVPLPPYYSLSLVDKITYNSPMSEVQGYISRWAEATFKHNEVGIAAHILSEAMEIYLATGGTPTEVREIAKGVWERGTKEVTAIPEETADLVILALTLAGYLDFDLTVEVIHKMSKNKLRKWGKPNKQGFTEHVREVENGREEAK